MADNQGLLQVSAEQHEELERWVQSRTLPAGDVFRARIVLALGRGIELSRDRAKAGCEFSDSFALEAPF